MSETCCVSNVGHFKCKPSKAILAENLCKNPGLKTMWTFDFCHNVSFLFLIMICFYEGQFLDLFLLMGL